MPLAIPGSGASDVVDPEAGRPSGLMTHDLGGLRVIS
jgi:hypothetical protein